MESPSVSGHPSNSFKPGTSGHLSFLSDIPSLSESRPPKLKVKAAAFCM